MSELTGHDPTDPRDALVLRIAVLAARLGTDDGPEPRPTADILQRLSVTWRRPCAMLEETSKEPAASSCAAGIPRTRPVAVLS